MTNGWSETPLGEVLIERRETPLEDDLTSGNVPIIAKIGFNDGKIELRNDGQTRTNMILIRPGDLVISGINAAKGAIAVYGEVNKEPIAATIHYGAYIPRKDKVDVMFLWWLLRSDVFRETLIRHVPGGIKSELKASRLLPVPVLLPDLTEQRRIVARIEALAAKVEEAQRFRQQAILELEALKIRAIDALVSESTLQREPLERFLTEPLLNGLSLPASKMGTGIVFAKVGVVNTGVFNPNETKLADIELRPNSPYWLHDGDIVVSRGNTPELVGRAAVYDGNPPNCAIPDLLIRVRVNRQLADPKFVTLFFRSREARKYVESQVTGTSPTMKKISQPKLMTMLIPALGVKEQQNIVAQFNDLNTKLRELRHFQDSTQGELGALLPSILDKAFKGEL